MPAITVAGAGFEYRGTTDAGEPYALPAIFVMRDGSVTLLL